MKPVTADRPLTLIRALARRTRAEGVRYLFIPVALFAAMITLAIVISLTGTGHVNGAKALAPFAERYGAHADAVTVGRCSAASARWRPCTGPACRPSPLSPSRLSPGRPGRQRC